MSHYVQIAAFEPDLAPNLGSLVRLGVCFDAPVHVIEPCGFPFSLKLLKTRALDYAEKADVRHHDSWQAFEDTKPGRLVLLTTKGATDLWDFSFQPGDCLLVGRESAGVPDHVHEAAGARVKIAMPGGGRSLNVAISAGIALAEAHRQLRLR
ncbi:tRNA (cytidine(34)-2'-O)-methyltransferase [Litoreibacter janthinus]|uniref:tRNA (cytidine(34)-2'-O)-methyltransferase n=1 Tax=Litoreibacter janthinus TaxID=670154 RepID=A0A1I6G1H5_9RHOB|nr:TrmH family RNA methyltransferase [Litoreibacter janthinus]SFR36044.1 tRNA (cytidine/uridine-2'-O-)-methyltransferase [Litoreibacter janthinus]